MQVSSGERCTEIGGPKAYHLRFEYCSSIEEFVLAGFRGLKMIGHIYGSEITLEPMQKQTAENYGTFVYGQATSKNFVN